MGRPRIHTGTTSVDKVAAKAGGMDKLAEWCGVDPSRPYNWRLPRKLGGRDGSIPDKYFKRILKRAEKVGVNITRADLLNM